MAARKPLVLNVAQQQQIQSGDTLQLQAAVAGAASLNMPHGTTPTSPVNGDVWTTSAGIFVQINGATVGPLSTGGGGGSGTPSGTSFPGSPASGDQFLRTDRGIEYYYDGTRWLSKQVFILRFQRDTGSSQPLTSSTSATDRSQNPWSAVYDIYIVDFVMSGVMTTGSTSTNYYTAQLIKSATSTDTNIGTALSNQNDTTGAHVTHRESINAVAASTVQDFSVNYTRVGTTATYFVTVSVSYRLVG